MSITPVRDGGLAAFVAAHPGRPRLLAFGAGWCAPCRAMAPALEDIAQLYDGAIAVARIDVEESPGLTRDFGVRGVPTLVALDGEGAETGRLVGGQSKTRLALLADAMLDAGDAA